MNLRYCIYDYFIPPYCLCGSALTQDLVSTPSWTSITRIHWEQSRVPNSQIPMWLPINVPRKQGSHDHEILFWLNIHQSLFHWKSCKIPTFLKMVDDCAKIFINNLKILPANQFNTFLLTGRWKIDNNYWKTTPS